MLQKFDGPGFSKSQREDTWQIIQAVISAISGMDRTSEELQKKWADLKSTAKKDIAKYRREIKQTGGGSSLSPPYEVYERIIQIIGE